MTYAIRVENLSKRYRIRHGDNASYRTLRDEITHAAGAPLRWLRGQRESSTEAFWALKDVSFDVQPGEVLGVIGRNGAGKSTLLKILSRITKPTQGRVEMRGRVGSLLEVGTGFHPELTGRENIYLSGAILGMKRAEIVKKFDEIVAFAEVERFLDTPVKRYSSGMYVRLAFSVAAHLEPDILIIDEVLAVGDAAFQKKCLGKLSNVAATGHAVVFVTHNMTAIKQLCNLSMLLNDGENKMFGAPNEVMQEYEEEYSAGLSEIHWDEGCAPGNENVRLRSIEVTNSSGARRDTFSLYQSTNLSIQYEVTRNNSVVNLSISVFASDGTLIFSSPSESDIRWYQKPHPVGVYHSNCRLPTFLNAGQYYVTVVLVNRGTPACQIDSAVGFSIRDERSDVSSYFGPWGGILRPQLEWSTHERLVDDSCLHSGRQP